MQLYFQSQVARLPQLPGPMQRGHLGPPPSARVDTGEQGASPAGAGGYRDSARLPAEAWGAGVPLTPLTTWVWTVRGVGPVQNQLVEVPPERQPLERSVWGCRPPSSWGVTGLIKSGDPVSEAPPMRGPAHARLRPPAQGPAPPPLHRSLGQPGLLKLFFSTERPRHPQTVPPARSRPAGVTCPELTCPSLKAQVR